VANLHRPTSACRMSPSRRFRAARSAATVVIVAASFLASDAAIFAASLAERRKLKLKTNVESSMILWFQVLKQ